MTTTDHMFDKSGGISKIPYKLLLIGETGFGKTSFLNLLCNYQLVETCGVESALEQLRKFNNTELENAQCKYMESKTSGVTLYKVCLNNLEIGIIDTPGLGDTRGIKEDQKHVTQIVEMIQAVGEINCVCVVINGRQARMTVTSRYVLAELTTIFPREIFNNIIVVFTNTINELSLSFELKSLHKYFGELEKYLCIENPYCQIEMVKIKGGKISDHNLVKSLTEKFQKVGKVLDRLCSVIKDSQAISSSHFTAIHEKRKQIDSKVFDILAAKNSQDILKEQLRLAQEQIKSAQQTKKLYKDYQINETTIEWKRVATPYHNVLCGTPGCFSTCHEQCELAKSFNKEQLKHCNRVSGATCRVCGHEYHSHFHDECKYERITKKNTKYDSEMRKKYEEANNKLNQAEQIKQNTMTKINDFDDMFHTLKLIIKEFHQMSLSNSYATLLETHLLTIQQRKEASESKEDLTQSIITEEEMKKKLMFVNSVL